MLGLLASLAVWCGVGSCVAQESSAQAGLASAQAGSASAQAGLAELKATELAIADLIERVEPSVVAVLRQPEGAAARRPQLLNPGLNDPFRNFRAGIESNQATIPAGAGVVIDPAGLVLTQYLVVSPGDQHMIATLDGEIYEAEIRAADPRSGLAVLAVAEADLPALTLGKAEDLRKGSGVVAIGNPNAVVTDGQPTASFGRVTNLARKAGDQVNLNNNRRGADFRTTLHHFGALIQTDARLGWNASGGAVVNLDGELVGVTTSVSVIAGHEQPAGYVIPMNEAFRRIVETLKEGREVEYGLLGVSFSVAANLPGLGPRGQGPQGRAQRRGIVVQEAYAGGPAGRAGLRRNDVILRVAGESAPDADSLQLLVGQQPPGKQISIEFLRDGKERQTAVTLGKYYADGQKVVTTPAPRWRGMRIDYATAVTPETLASASGRGLIDPEGCVVVADVDPASPSWQQGVRPNMFISHVGDVRVTSPDEFWEAVRAAEKASEESTVKLRFTQTPQSQQPTTP